MVEKWQSTEPLLAQEMAFEWVCVPQNGGNPAGGPAGGRGREGAPEVETIILPSDSYFLGVDRKAERSEKK